VKFTNFEVTYEKLTHSVCYGGVHLSASENSKNGCLSFGSLEIYRFYLGLTTKIRFCSPQKKYKRTY